MIWTATKDIVRCVGEYECHFGHVCVLRCTNFREQCGGVVDQVRI